MTGQVYFYIDDEIDAAELQAAAPPGVLVKVRGPRYAAERSKLDRPRAFISHDSRDKKTVVRPLAIGLSKLRCPIWFDEYALNLGDSLRESIEKGIKECGRCILIVSPRFLSNPGWTKVEFNSVFTRELLENRNIFLPIWHRVTKQQVFDYCPTLADRLAGRWSHSEVRRQELFSKVYRVISKPG